MRVNMSFQSARFDTAHPRLLHFERLRAPKTPDRAFNPAGCSTRLIRSLAEVFGVVRRPPERNRYRDGRGNSGLGGSGSR